MAFMNQVVSFIKSILMGPFYDSKEIWLLGRMFDLSKSEERDCFMKKWSSLILFTYRRNFPPISGTEITSDSGWGCTLRTAQMYIANAIMLHQLGNNFDTKEMYKSTRLNIIKLFNDRPEAPYSIHAFSLCGLKYKKAVGEWHGSHTAAKIIKRLFDRYTPDGVYLDVYISDEGIIYKDEVFSKHREGCIIMVPLCLGAKKFNSIYVDTVKYLFKFPNFLGVIGGKSKCSYFFAGLQSDSLLYFDPHETQEYVEINDNVDENDLIFETFRTKKTCKTSISSIDPSMMIGLYCRNVDDYEFIVNYFENKNDDKVKPVFFFAEKKTEHNDKKWTDVEVDNEMFTFLG